MAEITKIQLKTKLTRDDYVYLYDAEGKVWQRLNDMPYTAASNIKYIESPAITYPAIRLHATESSLASLGILSSNAIGYRNSYSRDSFELRQEDGSYRQNASTADLDIDNYPAYIISPLTFADETIDVCIKIENKNSANNYPFEIYSVASTLSTGGTLNNSPLPEVVLAQGEPLFNTNNNQLYVGKSDTEKVAFYNSNQVDAKITNLAGASRTTETVKGNAAAIAKEITDRQNAISSLDSTLGVTTVSSPSSSNPQTLIKSITQSNGKLTGLDTLDLVDGIIASTLGGKKAQKTIGGISQGSELGNTLAQILSDLFGIGTFDVTPPSVDLEASIGNPSDVDFLEYGQKADIDLTATFNSGRYPYGSSIASDPTRTGVTISNYGNSTYSNDDIKFTSTKDTTARYSQDGTPNTIIYNDQTITSNDSLSATISYDVAIKHTNGYTPLDADGNAVSDKAITAGSVSDSASINWYRAFFMGAVKSEIIYDLATRNGKNNYLSTLSNASIRSLSKFTSVKGTYEITIPVGSWGVLSAIPTSLTPAFMYLRNGSYHTFPVTYIGEISLPDASGDDDTKISYNVYAYDADMPYEANMQVKVQLS